jgi:hypothetical protein
MDQDGPLDAASGCRPPAWSLCAEPAVQAAALVSNQLLLIVLHSATTLQALAVALRPHRSCS